MQVLYLLFSVQKKEKMSNLTNRREMSDSGFNRNKIRDEKYHMNHTKQTARLIYR